MFYRPVRPSAMHVREKEDSRPYHKTSRSNHAHEVLGMDHVSVGERCSPTALTCLDGGWGRGDIHPEAQPASFIGQHQGCWHSRLNTVGTDEIATSGSASVGTGVTTAISSLWPPRLPSGIHSVSLFSVSSYVTVWYRVDGYLTAFCLLSCFINILTCMSAPASMIDR